MKRRDFIRVSSVAGMAGMVKPSYFPFSQSSFAEGFDLHPFIKKHPEAVFINLTSIENKTDAEAIREASYKLASEMFVKTYGSGHANTTKVLGKPNWTCTGYRQGDQTPFLGITTDTNFIEGFLSAVKNKGPQDIYLRECACASTWKTNGWVQMAERNNFDLREMTSKDYWQMDPGDIIFKEVNNGVVFKEVGFMAPTNTADTFLINMAKFKAHGMGVTGAIKNLQGLTAKRFHQFCGGSNDIFRTYDERYHKFFHADYMQRVDELQKKHVKDGVPRWDKPPRIGGFYMEQWVQRMLDSYSVTKADLHIIEGIYGRDGDGFNAGSHDGKPMDFMSNNIIFGLDAFRVDIISHWLAGHEPGNFGLFHIGIERGLSNVLDPFDIPVYVWADGKAKKVKLESLKRTPLETYYMQQDYNGMNEPKFHLCNEPFDYKAWKKTGKVQKKKGSITALGTDANQNPVMEVNVPDKGNVYVDIKNRHGEVIWSLEAKDLDPGVHEVVWDGFSQPGMYTMYVKGMEWDAERQMVIYT